MSLVALVGAISSIGKETAEFCRTLESAPEQLHSISAKLTNFRSLLEQLQQICAELIENNQNLSPSELKQLMSVLGYLKRVLKECWAAAIAVQRAFRYRQGKVSSSLRLRWAVFESENVRRLLQQLGNAELSLESALLVLLMYDILRFYRYFAPLF
jgi:hypothetical protein